jgi:hypothetical protein
MISSTVSARALGLALRQLHHPVRAGVARRHVVDGDAICGHLLRERLGQRDDASPVHVRHQQIVDRLLDRDRCDVDDAPPLLEPHSGQHGTHQTHRAHQGQLVGLQPVLIIKVAKVARWRAPIVSDQDVQPAVAAQGLVGQVPDLCFLRQVNLHGQHFRTGLGTDFVGRRVERLFAPSADHDGRPVTRQLQRAGLAQAPARSADDSHASLQPKVHFCPPVDSR